MNKVHGFKGYDKNLQCRGFQYEVGKTYEHEGKAVTCESGFHFCEYPLDVFSYYPPADSRYTEVVGEGCADNGGQNDTKVCASKLTIGAEIGIPGIVKASIEYIKSHIDADKKEANTGDSSVASNTGDRSMASNTGNRSMASNTGNRSMASNTGDRSMASNTGYSSMASNTGYSSMASNTGDSSVASNTGYRSMASNTGDRSMASNTGDSSVASNTGDWSMASNTGDSSVASNTGYSSMASNTGDRSMASNTGDWSMASNTGNRSMASNTGYSSMASVEGNESIAVAIGYASKAKGALGCWIVLGEQKQDDEYNWHLVDVQCFKVDGEKIKADTFYKLKDGQPIEAEE